VIAHVGGVPIEEALLPLVSWAGAGLLLARAWVASRVPVRPSAASARTLDAVQGGGDGLHVCLQVGDQLARRG
jgi:hypothetical protein